MRNLTRTLWMSVTAMFLTGMVTNAVAQSRIENLTSESRTKRLSPKEVVAKDRNAKKKEAKGQDTPYSIIHHGAGINNVPFLETFDDQTAFNTFIVLDKNEDGSTWKYYSTDNCARYFYSSTNDADDWLLTPLIHMEGGKSYFFSFKFRRGYSPERLAVAWGTGEDPATYTILEEGFDIENTSYETYTKEINVETTGDYHFGIHAISPKDKFYIAIDDVAVDEGSHTEAPDSVTSLNILPDPTAAIAAQISFKTPAVDGKGNPISTLTKVEVLRNGTVVHEFNTPNTGEQLTCNITGGEHDINTFAIIAYNESGAGRMAERKVWLGLDTPQYPLNITLIDNGATLTTKWDNPPTAGVHGGVTIPANITYNVYNWAEEKIGSGITGNELLDDDAETGGKVGALQYYVTAQNEAGESEMGGSNWIVTGDPYTLPIVQSFQNGTLGDLYWWIPFFQLPCWYITREISYDNDGGALLFYAEKPGDEGWFNSAKITVQEEANPHVTLAYYAYPGIQNKLEVIASKMQHDDLVLASIDFSELEGEEGWRTLSLSLDEAKDVSSFVLRLHAVCNDLEHPVLIDAMSIKDIKHNDLAAYISVPEASYTNKPANINVKVINEGSGPAQDYTVSLYCDDVLVESKNSNEAIAPSNIKDYIFSYVPTVYSNDTLKFNAKIEYAPDEYLKNNTSEKQMMQVVRNTQFPSVNDLTGTQEGNSVNLAWTTPQQPDPTTETFDFYNAWSIDYLGLWTLVDKDGAYSYSINGVYFPHSGDRFAYIIFNPEAAGFDLTENPMIAPHSGNQFLACMAADPEFATAGHNDDWLISPELTGNAQTVSFWAKSLFNKYPETFEVLYSTTGTDIADFTANALTVEAVPDEWTEYSAQLPAGAKHFAIHCISADKFMFMLDDISYNQKPMTLTGYNIYRDGELIGSAGAGATSYEDHVTGGETHNYQITAIYEEGESDLSNIYSTGTGIENMNGSQMSIVGQTGQIVVNCAENTIIRIYTADGSMHRTTTGGANTIIRINPGLYIVKAGSQVKRVIVK